MSYIGTLKKQLKARTPNEYTGIRELSLLEDKIREEGDLVTKETKYEGIVKVVDDKGRFYIYNGTQEAFVVPYTAFVSEKEKFLALLRERCRRCEFV